MRTLWLVLVFALVPLCGSGERALAEDAVAQALERLLSGTNEVRLDGGTIGIARVKTFYADHGNQPAWHSAGSWSEAALAAVGWLGSVVEDGLEPLDYPAGSRPLPPPGASPEETARAELMLTDSLLRYAADIGSGRKAPREIDPELYVYPRQVDAAATLKAGLAEADFLAWLASLAPDHRDYRVLKKALARFHALAASGPWPQLPEGPKLEPGMRDPRLSIVRRQLADLGDLANTDADDPSFDQGLLEAIKAFQARHGLEADGVIGPATRGALNRTPAQRATQIALNLERLRWLSPDLGSRHVVVNIAGFELAAVENGKTVLRMPVVVGRDYRRTPVFSDRMTDLILSPTWTPTPNIARNDILPKVKEDIGFLQSKGFRVFSDWSAEAVELDPAQIDWSTVTPAKLSLKFVQRPGPLNALGRVRFSLANDFNIYLHDTPDKNLFGKTRRAFSSGCIRVGDAMALAVFALKGNAHWTEERLAAAMDSGERQVARLAEPLPVHLTYMTAWIDEAGILQFREDIYGRDRTLARALGVAEML